MTLCLPVLAPIAKATATSARSAQAVTSAVKANIGAPSFPPRRQDLVHAHPALFERQRGARQVQPPHPGALPADDGLDRGQVRLQVVEPGPDRADVVRSHRLNAEDLEARVLEPRD